MFSSEVIVNSLDRFYPEVAEDIKKRLETLMPAPNTDISKLPYIVRIYCDVNSIEQNNITGRAINSKYTHYRKELLAVVMMFYQPEKLYGISKKQTKSGLINALSNILECRGNYLSNLIPEIIVYFRTYQKFSSSISGNYEKIKNILHSTLTHVI